MASTGQPGGGRIDVKVFVYILMTVCVCKDLYFQCFVYTALSKRCACFVKLVKIFLYLHVFWHICVFVFAKFLTFRDTHLQQFNQSTYAILENIYCRAILYRPPIVAMPHTAHPSFAALLEKRISGP